MLPRRFNFIIDMSLFLCIFIFLDLRAANKANPEISAAPANGAESFESPVSGN